MTTMSANSHCHSKALAASHQLNRPRMLLVFIFMPKVKSHRQAGTSSARLYLALPAFGATRVELNKAVTIKKLKGCEPGPCRRNRQNRTIVTRTAALPAATPGAGPKTLPSNEGRT